MFDVIIVGAGPAGLMLAIDLMSKGVSCKVIEKRQERSISSRAFGLMAHTLELLDIHNLADPLIAEGVLLEQVPLGIQNLYMNMKKIESETKFPFMLSISQANIENFLENYAKQKGVVIEKGVTVTNLVQHNEYCELIISNGKVNWSEYASFVVGADGKNSNIRELSNIDLLGFTYDKTIMHGDVQLSKQAHHLTFSKLSRHGMVAYFKLPLNQYYRVLVLDHRKMDTPTDKKLELDEFIDSANFLAKTDLGIKNPLWLIRFRSQHKNATCYRLKRIFLIGDAAHIHPPAGGQGLQVAIQDAFNLGWKLANAVRKNGSERVLNSYELERKPIIEKSLRMSRYLFKYEISKSFFAFLAKMLFVQIIRIPFLQKSILINLSCMNARHKIWNTKQHRLIGQHAYRYQFKGLLGGTLLINAYLKQGAFLLILNHNNTNEFKPFLSKYIQNINLLSGQLAQYDDINMVLIRPDGLIVWIARSLSNVSDLSKILEYWLGDDGLKKTENIDKSYYQKVNCVNED